MLFAKTAVSLPKDECPYRQTPFQHILCVLLPLYICQMLLRDMTKLTCNQLERDLPLLGIKNPLLTQLSDQNFVGKIQVVRGVIPYHN